MLPASVGLHIVFRGRGLFGKIQEASPCGHDEAGVNNSMETQPLLQKCGLYMHKPLSDFFIRVYLVLLCSEGKNLDNGRNQKKAYFATKQEPVSDTQT